MERCIFNAKIQANKSPSNFVKYNTIIKSFFGSSFLEISNKQSIAINKSMEKQDIVSPNGTYLKTKISATVVKIKDIKNAKNRLRENPQKINVDIITTTSNNAQKIKTN